jgi:hypothetical protein
MDMKDLEKYSKDSLIAAMWDFQLQAVILANKLGILQHCSEETQKRASKGEATIEEVLSDPLLVEKTDNYFLNHCYHSD